MREEAESLNRLARFRSRLHSTDQKGKRQSWADGWWDSASKWGHRLVTSVAAIVASAAGIVTIFVVGHLLYEAFVSPSVVIEPISVPKDMEEKGFTPDVAALHLLDAMNKYLVHGRTSGAGPNLKLHRDPADFVLPIVGLPFKAVVRHIRAYVPGKRSKNISGEIARVDGMLRLQLRKDAVVIPENSEGADAEGLEALFDDAALRVLAAANPYYEAVAKSENNSEAAVELAQRIIADQPPDHSDGDVVWAHNLLGWLLYQQGKFQKTDGEDSRGAIEEFEWVIKHKPDFAIAHLNLGLVYLEQGHTDRAIEAVKDAIKTAEEPIKVFQRAGELGTAHQILGDMLNKRGNEGDAENAGCEYLEAIFKFHEATARDPFSPVAHQRLGTALKNKEKVADCSSHKSVPEDLARYDSTLAEYQRAIELDQNDAHIRYDLAGILREDELDKSIAELRKALDSHKARDGSFDTFRYELLRTLSRALRIKGKNVEKVGDCLKDKSEYQEADQLFCQAFAENEALIARIERKAIIDKKPCNNAVAYRRRGVDLYQMGDFRNAVAAHNEALRIDETYLADKIDRGYAKFALADFDGAAKDFEDVLHLLKRDQADTMMTWLYLSQEHSRMLLGDRYYQQKDRDHPSKALEDNALKLLWSNRKDWRIKLFLGNELPANVLKPDDILKNIKGTDKQCKTYFYIGEWYAIKQPKDADEWLRQAVKVCPFDLVERSAAKAELERIGIGSQDVATIGVSPGFSTNPRHCGL